MIQTAPTEVVRWRQPQRAAAGPILPDGLPASLRAGVAGWAEAITERGPAAAGSWYAISPRVALPDPLWNARGAGAAPGVQLTRIERVDDARADAVAMQLAVIGRVADAGATRCVRSSQIWRIDTDGRWRIARERAIAASASNCE